MGLLFNEAAANDGSGGEQDEPGDAHPQSGENGGYLLEFPESGSETNTDTDDKAENGNGRSDGSYTWIVLQNGQIQPAYKGSDGNWYTGYNDVFP